MSGEGWQLTKGGTFKYVFEKGEPNEYEYRLELLDNTPDDKQSKEYIDFLKETEIEKVGEYGSWIFLRKKKAHGGFGRERNTLFHLQHSVKVEEIYQNFRNIFMWFMAISIIGTFIIRNFEESNVVSFFDGFLFGIGISSAIISLIFMIFVKSNLKKIKSYIKELYVNEGF